MLPGILIRMFRESVSHIAELSDASNLDMPFSGLKSMDQTDMQNSDHSGCGTRIGGLPCLLFSDPIPHMSPCAFPCFSSLISLP